MGTRTAWKAGRKLSTVHVRPLSTHSSRGITAPSKGWAQSKAGALASPGSAASISQSSAPGALVAALSSALVLPQGLLGAAGAGVVSVLVAHGLEVS